MWRAAWDFRARATSVPDRRMFIFLMRQADTAAAILCGVGIEQESMQNSRSVGRDEECTRTKKDLVVKSDNALIGQRTLWVEILIHHLLTCNYARLFDVHRKLSCRYLTTYPA